MQAKISLHIKALSINAMYYGNRLHGKTQAAKEWTAQVCGEVNRYSTSFEKLRSHFDVDKHAYKLAIKFYSPKFFTAGGDISAQSMDLSNVEKGLIDILFLPNYNGTSNYSCSNLNIDDKYIVALYSSKEYAADYRIDVTIKIVNKPKRPE